MNPLLAQLRQRHPARRPVIVPTETRREKPTVYDNQITFARILLQVLGEEAVIAFALMNFRPGENWQHRGEADYKNQSPDANPSKLRKQPDDQFDRRRQDAEEREVITGFGNVMQPPKENEIHRHGQHDGDDREDENAGADRITPGFFGNDPNGAADRHRDQSDPNPRHDARRPAASQDEFVPKFARLRRALESQDPIANFKVSENFWDVGKRADCSDNAQLKGPFRLPAETTDQESGDKKCGNQCRREVK